jgi:L-asparaginase
MADAKKILMISTGGTIGGNVADSSVAKASPKGKSVGDFKGRIEPTLKSIKANWNIDVEINTHTLCDVDSSDILPSHWTALSEIVRDKYDHYDSFVITHGTNTLGYTCAALSFAFENINKPVILTGSQVPFGNPGSDALMNLDNAIQIAVYPYALTPIKGVVAVFGSHIITGVRVKKSTEFDYDAFQTFTSSSLGRIGRIISLNENNVKKHVDYMSKHSNLALTQSTLKVRNAFDTSIASFTEFPGMSKDLFKTVVENNDIKGIILRAFGAGDASNELHEGFTYLKEKEIPIVVTTQAPNGISNFQVNEPGQKLQEQDLAIPAFDMSIESQTTKLAWLLGQKTSYEMIKIKMIEDLRGEINVTRDRK